jgi:hypothetical protein
MSVNSTNSNAGNAAMDAIAKPLTELTLQQRKKVTTELARIHDLVSAFDEKPTPKHDAPYKSKRSETIDFSPNSAR